MGGNGTYKKELNAIPEADRTHYENGSRIDGHKILVQQKCPKQVKVPMNSNSESPLYLCASKVVENDTVVGYVIKSIGIYEKHKCIGQIDLKFDKGGKLLPFSATETGSHYHQLYGVNAVGSIGRKPHDANNYRPIPDKYIQLVKKIEQYNQSQKR